MDTQLIIDAFEANGFSVKHARSVSPERSMSLDATLERGFLQDQREYLLNRTEVFYVTPTAGLDQLDLPVLPAFNQKLSPVLDALGKQYLTDYRAGADAGFKSIHTNDYEVELLTGHYMHHPTRPRVISPVLTNKHLITTRVLKLDLSLTGTDAAAHGDVTPVEPEQRSLDVTYRVYEVDRFVVHPSNAFRDQYLELTQQEACAARRGLDAANGEPAQIALSARRELENLAHHIRSIGGNSTVVDAISGCIVRRVPSYDREAHIDVRQYNKQFSKKKRLLDRIWGW